MKKLIWIIAVIFTTTLTSFADDEKVLININKNEKHTDNPKWDRAPMRIPVEVYYNSENKVIRVEGSETVEAEVFLYNKYEELTDYSSTINAEFQLTLPGEYTILIQNENWYGEAIVNAY